MEYAAFERTFGPLTIQERLDVNGAIGAWASVAAMGSKTVKFTDFLPQWERRADMSPEDMVAVMRGLQRPKRKKAK